MKFPRRRFLELAGVAAAASALPRPALALDYPTRPVRFVVGFPAGGQQDTMARLICQWLSERLGQQFLVENRSGAGGNVGAEAVINSPPDGYTMLLVGSPNAINATLYQKLNFVFLRDIVPVASFARTPLVVEVHPSVPVHTLPEFIAYAKANPGKVNYASAGIGTVSHVCGEYFGTVAGVSLVHIPYKGTGPAITDLLGGHIPMAFAPVPATHENAKAGKLRMLAVTSAARSALLPEVPTIAEAALPGFEAVLRYGLVAPAGTPAAIIERLNAALNAALKSDDVRARLAIEGAEPLPSTPAEYAADIDREETQWSKVVKASGAKAE